MSTFKVEIVKFELKNHEAADTLSVATVKGWTCIVKTEDFKNENLGVYIPIDAVASKDHPLLGFLEGKKVKTKKLRGIISQGVLLPLNKVKAQYPKEKWDKYKEGDDLHKLLKIKKWQPPVKPAKLGGGGGYPFATTERPGWLQKYTDIENWNNYPDVIPEGEEVVVTEKLHGTSAIFALVQGKFYICSRNRCLRMGPITVKRCPSKKRNIKRFWNTHCWLRAVWYKKETIPPENSVWHQTFKEFDLAYALTTISRMYNDTDVALYGEIVGVQDLMYGLDKGKLDFYLYDIRMGKVSPNLAPLEYLNHTEFEYLAAAVNLKTVPSLYKGPFNRDVLDLRSGKTTINGANHIREGIVIEPRRQRTTPELGRVILKRVSEEYLLRKKGTDY